VVPWVKMFITSCLPLVRPALRLIHRQPELPPGLDEFEQRVMESDWPPVVYVDRALIRALLRYVRRLERDLGEGILVSHVLPGDCREVLATLPADSVDAVVTDPPYSAPAGGGWIAALPRARMLPRTPTSAYRVFQTPHPRSRTSCGERCASPDAQHVRAGLQHAQHGSPRLGTKCHAAAIPFLAHDAPIARAVKMHV
jgi:hypothetical protein